MEDVERDLIIEYKRETTRYKRINSRFQGILNDDGVQKAIKDVATAAEKLNLDELNPLSFLLNLSHKHRKYLTSLMRLSEQRRRVQLAKEEARKCEGLVKELTRLVEGLRRTTDALHRSLSRHEGQGSASGPTHGSTAADARERAIEAIVHQRQQQKRGRNPPTHRQVLKQAKDLDALEVEVNDLIKRVTPFMDMPDDIGAARLQLRSLQQAVESAEQVLQELRVREANAMDRMIHGDRHFSGRGGGGNTLR